MAAVRITGSSQVVFLQKSCVDQLLAGVVDQLSTAVGQIEIALVIGEGDILTELFNAAEIHIHQQNAAFDGAPPGQLHLTA